MDFWTFFNDTMNNEGTIHSLLLLLYNLEDDDMEKFLNNDNFRKGVENDGKRKFLINELEKIKKYLRDNIYLLEPLRDEFDNLPHYFKKNSPLHRTQPTK